MRAVGVNPCARRALASSCWTRRVCGISPAALPLARRGAVVLKAQGEKVPLVKSIDEEAESMGGNFCSIDDQGKKVRRRTVGEMEQEFIEAMSAWYFDKKALLTDEEFENLREELLWNGSKVAVLDKGEQKFLEASYAYARGQPIMTDAEYDELKSTLRNTNSIVTAQGPRCSIRSRRLYSDAVTDVLRMTALNIPAVLLVLGIVFALDDITGFEVTKLVELPPPYGVFTLWGLLLPVIFVLATALTNIGFKDGLILKGPCPECGTENYTYFGDLFTVRGNRGTNVVECPKCTASLTFDQNKRIVLIDETPEEKQKKAAAAAAKKAAAAAKKKQAAAKA